MPLEFFRFPYEIREMVYQATFDTPKHDGIIAPDQHHTRSRSGKKELTDRIIGGSAFLRTCQQAYAEAYPFLYKDSNIYYFDDVTHSSDVVDLEPDPRCECVDREPWTRYEYVPVCKRHTPLPQCDFTVMPDWLTNIGKRNRLRIRHIHLHFNGPIFTRLSHSSSTIRRPTQGGDFIDRALEILAPEHNLETVKVSFAQPTEGDATKAIELWHPIVEAFNNLCPYWGMVFGDKPVFIDIWKAKAPLRKGLPTMDLAFSLMKIMPIKALTVEGGTPPLNLYHAYHGIAPFFAGTNFDLNWHDAREHTPKYVGRLQEWMVTEYKPGQKITASPVAWSGASIHQYSCLESG